MRSNLTVLLRRLLLALVVLTVLRVLFYLFNRVYFPDYETGVLLKAFGVGTLSDLQVTAIFFAPFIGIHLLPFRWQDRYIVQQTAWFLFLLPLVVIIAFSLAEIAYFPFSFQRMSIGLLRVAGDSPMGFFAMKYWYFLLVFVVLLFGVTRLYGSATGAVYYSKRTYWIYVVLVVLAWWLAITGGRKRPMMPSDLTHYVPANAAVLATNTPQHMLFSIYLDKYRQRKMLQRKSYMPDNEADSLFSIYHYPKTSGEFKPYNVVIFVLESFSRAYLEPGNLNKANTPFLDSLRQESLVCTNAFANASISLGGLTAILGGIPPITAASHMESPYSNNFLEPFWSILQKRGYQTAFFYGGEEDHFGFNRLTRQLGIEKYYSMEDFGDDTHYDGVWGIFDGPFFSYAEKQISATPVPFASVIFNLSSHFPYTVPKEYAGIIPKGKLNSHQGITYVDLCLRQFFAEAKNKAWFRESIFVFVADHWSKEDNSVKAHGAGRFEIPLMIYMPDGTMKGKFKGVADQLSIIPTLADIMHLPYPYMSFGQSLLDSTAPRYSFGLQEFPYQYHLIGDDKELLYDEKREEITGIYSYKKEGYAGSNTSSEVSTQEKLLEKQLKARIQVHHRSMIENKLLPPP